MGLKIKIPAIGQNKKSYFLTPDKSNFWHFSIIAAVL
jgi:hypothetical protein